MIESGDRRTRLSDVVRLDRSPLHRGQTGRRHRDYCGQRLTCSMQLDGSVALADRPGVVNPSARRQPTRNAILGRSVPTRCRTDLAWNPSPRWRGEPETFNAQHSTLNLELGTWNGALLRSARDRRSDASRSGKPSPEGALLHAGRCVVYKRTAVNGVTRPTLELSGPAAGV